MFTGIIEGMGTVRSLARKGEDAFLTLDTAVDLAELKVGDSIAVNGACLTATAKTKTGFQADVSAETLERTNLKTIKTGDKVNLEKSLRLSDFLGGHIVLGHVDGVGKIRQKTEKSNSIIIAVDVTEHLTRYIVEKGSVAVDGISLTVNQCQESCFYVNVIPHTAQATTIGFRKVGDAVNIETDILGKYVEKLLRAGRMGNKEQNRKIDLNFLTEHGYL
ncbi:MAG: riboflavin synthase [Deltaproteobacteria bacterium]|nr:riboflavin synthase [Deltaproteobacteria bacterium]